MPLTDLHTTISRLKTGASTAQAELERAIATAKSSACRHVFLKTMFDDAHGDTYHHSGCVLRGLPVSVKDLFELPGKPRLRAPLC